MASPLYYALLISVIDATSSEPACVGEVLTMRKCRIVGIHAECVAECACILSMSVELIGEHLAVFLDNLKGLRTDKLALSVVVAVFHDLDPY